VSVDVYSCKKFDAREVEEYVQRWFSPRSVQAQLFFRGQDLLKRSFPDGRIESTQQEMLAEAG